ncbi:MAG: Fis family transcriptional regulator, partial [Candidatus Competibacteraceae bacterium]|nr:Fis family transcriptional regulator [Candidatus Competibacteraceae bacterium]
PGNIRELRNVIERAMILSRSQVLEVMLSRPAPPPALSASAAIVQQSQRSHILSVLEQTGWRIRGKGGAAELLGVKPTTLESRMQRLGINRPK